MPRIKPILFNTEMVQAILDGRKIATRRAVKKFSGRKEVTIYKTPCGEFYVDVNGFPTDFQLHPPYQPGDVLWVRETWATTENGQDYLYKADSDTDGAFIRDKTGTLHCPGWHPSIHMPYEAARIFLRVTEVRVERLREITEEGAVREGLYKGWRLQGQGSLAISARQAFMWLWETLTREAPAANSWACNPWVWVIEFERCERPEAAVKKIKEGQHAKAHD